MQKGKLRHGRRQAPLYGASVAELGVVELTHPLSGPKNKSNYWALPSGGCSELFITLWSCWAEPKGTRPSCFLGEWLKANPIA